MKKLYTSPKASVENFEANEYVATCWKVGCSSKTTYSNSDSGAPYGDMWSSAEKKDNVFNHTGDCTNAENNYFTGNADGSNMSFVMETNSQQGKLKGGFDRWVDVNGSGTVDSGDVIYWYTDNGTLRWNHWGYVQTTDMNHPNRS